MALRAGLEAISVGFANLCRAYPSKLTLDVSLSLRDTPTDAVRPGATIADEVITEWPCEELMVCDPR